MASTIKIKRSGSTAAPAALGSGELAYSWNVGKLYLGTGTETEGVAASIDIVGGKVYIDMLDHAAGTLTANSAIVVDADSKIDILNVDNLTLNGNTLSSTDANGNILITPNGTGKTVLSNVYVDDSNTSLVEYIQDVTGGVIVAGEAIDVTYDDNANTVTIDAELASSTNRGVATFNTDNFSVTAQADVLLIDQSTIALTAGQYGSSTAIPQITVNKYGIITELTTVDVATGLAVAADAGQGTGTIDLLTETLTVLGGEGIDVTFDGTQTFTISGEDASSTNKGIASFNSTNFTVTNGAVASNNITLGSTALTLGESTTEIVGLTKVNAGNISIATNVISYEGVDTDGNIKLAPKGAGVIDATGSRITNVATPSQTTDAANKGYVDSVVSGLDPKESVVAATTTNLGGLSGEQIIDGVQLVTGNRVLVKDQTIATENGIYVVDSGAWTRATDFDSGTATPGAFFFVEQGTVNADSGWVVSTDGVIIIGDLDPQNDTEINFVQFSGAGQVVAGIGLTKTGNTLDVSVATSGGIEIVGDALQLKSSVAGAGLTYTSGVIDIVGTADRITVNADSIDIASSYAGQTSITTLGTITTGTWQATTISVAYGGTGATTLADKGILVGNDTAAVSSLVSANGSNTPTTSYAILTTDVNNEPVWTDVLDGGTF